MCLAGAPTCSNLFLGESPRTRSMECSQQSSRDPCFLKGECNQGAACPTQKAKRLTQPLVHMDQAGPEDCRSQALMRLGGGGAGRRSCFVSLREQALRTSSVSQGRDREGHEHALLSPSHIDGVWLITGPAMVTHDMTLLPAGGSENKHGWNVNTSEAHRVLLPQ